MTSSQRPFSIGLCFPFFSSLRFHFATARYIYILCNEFSEKEKVHVEPPVILRAQWKRKPPNPKKGPTRWWESEPQRQKNEKNNRNEPVNFFFLVFIVFSAFPRGASLLHLELKILHFIHTDEIFMAIFLYRIAFYFPRGFLFIRKIYCFDKRIYGAMLSRSKGKKSRAEQRNNFDLNLN